MDAQYKGGALLYDVPDMSTAVEAEALYSDGCRLGLIATHYYIFSTTAEDRRRLNNSAVAISRIR